MTYWPDKNNRRVIRMNYETAPTHSAPEAPRYHRKRRAPRCRFARRHISRALSVCFLSLCLLPSAVSADQLFTTDGVNVRSGPSSDSSISFAVPDRPATGSPSISTESRATFITVIFPETLQIPDLLRTALFQSQTVLQIVLRLRQETPTSTVQK